MAELTLDVMKQVLKDAEQRYHFEVSDESWEQNSAALREAMSYMGLDPADPQTVTAMLTSAFLAFGHLRQSMFVVGPALPLTYIQVQVLRMWLEGELPVISLAETMSIRAMEAMNDPGPCPFVLGIPGEKQTQPCRLRLQHDGMHKVLWIAPGPDGIPALQEIECEEVPDEAPSDGE